MGNLLEKLNNLYDILVKEKASNSAEEIEKIINNIGDIKELEHLVLMCHPKWLGDVYIECLTWQEWWKLIGDVGREAEKEILRLKFKEYSNLLETLKENIEVFYNEILSMGDTRSIEKLARIKVHLLSKKYIMQLRGLCKWFSGKENGNFSCKYGNWEDFLRELDKESEIWHQKLLDDQGSQNS